MVEAGPVPAMLLANNSKSYCVEGARPDTVRLLETVLCDIHAPPTEVTR
jgi:hypothetical protein